MISILYIFAFAASFPPPANPNGERFQQWNGWKGPDNELALPAMKPIEQCTPPGPFVGGKSGRLTILVITAAFERSNF